MKQKLITLSSPVAVRDTRTKQTFVVNVVEGYVNQTCHELRLLRIYKVYDVSTRSMTHLSETVTLEVKATNIRSIQEL